VGRVPYPVNRPPRRSRPRRSINEDDEFESQVCDHMVAIHHAHKRTDIRRHDKNQRGYAGVCLQDATFAAPSPELAQPELVPF
jgi:hypothetical protein